MSMGSSIFSFFKQLDLYEEFLAISKPTDRLLIYSEHLDLRYVMDFGGREKVYVTRCKPTYHVCYFCDRE